MRWLAVSVLLAFAIPGAAADFGDPKDVKEVRRVVTAKFKHALHASVSHDWALCTAYSGEADLSVVLRRAGAAWKVVESDGGAFDKGTLRKMGVPAADIPALLRAYQ